MSRDRFLRAGRGLIALLAVLTVATGCTPLDDAMVAIFGRSMRDSRSFDPYENPHLPAEGAVPFAQGDYTPTALPQDGERSQGVVPNIPDFTDVDMARGGEVAAAMVNPVEATEESLARGEEVYDVYCAVCHGPNGISAEAPIAEKLPVVMAFNLASGNAVDFSDGYLYGMVRVGRGSMPGYGHRITHFDRWNVVNYVRELQARAAGTQGGGDQAGQAEQADGEGS